MSGESVQMVRQLEKRIAKLEAQIRRPSAEIEAMSKVISLLQVFPGVVGIWPGSTPGASGQLIDKSGNGLTLTRQNGLFGYDSAIPRLSFDSSVPRYWNRADEAATSITGTESHNISKGLTMLAWLNINAVGASTQTAIAKWNAAGDQRSYSLFFDNSGNVLGQVSSDGTAAGIKSVTGPTYVTGSWAQYTCRFIPSVEISVWVNDTKLPSSSGIPASIFNSTADFTIGAIHGGGLGLSGRGSIFALFSAAVPDDTIKKYYYTVAPYFD